MAVKEMEPFYETIVNRYAIYIFIFQKQFPPKNILNLWEMANLTAGEWYGSILTK